MELKHHPAVLSRGDSFVIDPRLLKIEHGYNVRQLDTPETREHIDGLKESIAINSVRVPLEVRLKGEDIYIVAGHCRWMAVMELIAEGHEEIRGVPCVREPKTINDAERTLNLAISNSGKPLTTLEVAEVVRRLEGFGWSPEEIRKRMNWKSRATVTQHEEIAALPEEMKQHARNGEISPTLLRNLAKGKTPEEAEALIKANIEENKRIRGTGKRNVRVTAGTLQRDAKPKPAKPAPTETIEQAEMPAWHHNFADYLHQCPEPRKRERSTAAAADQVDAAAEALREAARETALLNALETLATEARNQIEVIAIDCPTWNYSALAEAVEHAERIIEQVNLDNSTLPAEQHETGSDKFGDREVNEESHST